MEISHISLDGHPKEETLKTMGEIVERTEDVCVFKVEPKKLLALITHISETFEVIDLQISSVPLEEIIGEIFRKNPSKR